MVAQPATPPTTALIHETESETDSTPATSNCPTPETGTKRKFETIPAKPSGITDITRQKQSEIKDYYGPLCWYNTPISSHNSSITSDTLPEITLSFALHPHLKQSTLAMATALSTFVPLTSDEYIELVTTIATQCGITVSDKAIRTADQMLTYERIHVTASEPQPKLIKNEILTTTRYTRL